MYQSHKIEGGKARVSFTHVGQGLASRPGDKLQGFAVAGRTRCSTGPTPRSTATLWWSPATRLPNRLPSVTVGAGRCRGPTSSTRTGCRPCLPHGLVVVMTVDHHGVIQNERFSRKIPSPACVPGRMGEGLGVKAVYEQALPGRVASPPRPARRARRFPAREPSGSSGVAGGVGAAVAVNLSYASQIAIACSRLFRASFRLGMNSWAT